ncbi:MFS transporter [Eupransor demetentiae]|uniref:Na+/melibiose symporter or related transporter (MelB) n=1 Tax=Eupransor demetentiae TaxID=3109584 RepID=A0ABP0EQD3_9LACO|nr:Na+/melibiose symporter or related transporter (MelB) [Lactobacillaceae bacterium LMG 33000]
MIASNICAQPYKMLVGDLVSDEQRGQAFSIQSLLMNGGTVLATITPFVMTSIGISNTAKAGVVPDTVKYAFYFAAAAIALCSIVTIWQIDELSPAEFKALHGQAAAEETPRKSMWQLTKESARIFWLVGLVQFFAFFAFSYLWVYGAGAMAKNIYNAVDANSAGYQAGGNLFGIYSAFYALVIVFVTILLSRLPRKYYRLAWTITLFIAGAGFVLIFLAHDLVWMTVAFVLVGVGWSGTNIYPVTFITDAAPKDYMGTYIGLMNIQVCIPQIAASILSVIFLPMFHGSMPAMIFLAAFVLFAAGLASLLISDTDV